MSEMNHDEGLGGTLLDERTVFTLREICHVCGVHAELVVEMVEEGVLEPEGTRPTEWRFRGDAVIRAQRALRLVRDLRLNWPGAALAIELLEELEALRREQAVLERELRLPSRGRF